MSRFVGKAKDRRGIVRYAGTAARAWHYRIMLSRPMISWKRARVGTLNGNRYEFAVTQCPRTKNAYAYFWWQGELLFFSTGQAIMDEGQAIFYAGSATNKEAARCSSMDPENTIPNVQKHSSEPARGASR